MRNILLAILHRLPARRQRQLLCLSVLMFVLGLVEVCLAGSISLLGIALATPDKLMDTFLAAPLLKVLPLLPDSIGRQTQIIIVILIAICVITLLKNGLALCLIYWQWGISQAVGWDISIIIFSNYVYAPYVWHTQNNPGELHNYLSWRYEVSTFILGFLQAISQLGILVFLMVGAFILAPLESLIFYTSAASVAAGVYKFSQQKAREAGTHFARLSTKGSHVTHGALFGIRELQIYGQQDAFRHKFSALAAPSIEARTKQGSFPHFPNCFLETTGMVLLLGSAVFMAMRGDSTANVTATLALLAGISWRMLPAINKTVGGVLQLKAYLSQVQTLCDRYLVLPHIKTHSKHYPFEHSLRLQNIGFSYPGSKEKVLRNITLEIPKGSMVGLVGISGSGKSTLVDVLTGLLEPCQGTIILDGKEIPPGPGFIKMGYVSQNPYILDASLAENVAFGAGEQELDFVRVRECCRMAAADFIDDLPDGMQTVLGERGVKLSGGQAQRVAIARALYGQPEILIFDEATSALDGAAEACIQKTIQHLKTDITIVLIAHRLSTVEACDNVYWIHEGTVRCHGSGSAVLPQYELFLEEQTQEGNNTHE